MIAPVKLISAAIPQAIAGTGEAAGLKRLLGALHQGQEEVVDVPDCLGERAASNGLMM